jgi:hypothetical protein
MDMYMRMCNSTRSKDGRSIEARSAVNGKEREVKGGWK